MTTLASVALPGEQWVRVDTPVPWTAGNRYRLQAKTNTAANLYVGATPAEPDSQLLAPLEKILVDYDGTAVWLRVLQFTGEVAIEDLGPVSQGGGGGGSGGGGSGTITGYALETTQQQVLQTLQAIEASRPVPIALTATSAGQTVYALPFQPTDAANSRLEYNGLTYRLTGGDYTIAGSTLTLTNPVIAPAAGNTFTLITA